MITGYNTDVEFNGVVYHVQTEDKGLQTPIILSLVYSGGAILAAKRSPYDDLVARGFDETVLAERLQRQHKLICAAIHAGRIEDLKQMANRGPSAAKQSSAGSETAAELPGVPELPSFSDLPSLADLPSVAELPSEPPDEIDDGESQADRFSISGESSEGAGLSVTFLEPDELRAGTSVTIKLRVRRQSWRGKRAVADANVTVKTLGTTFSPQSSFGTTDNRGTVTLSLSLPNFTAGRAAVLVRAESNGEIAELRKVILPANS